MKMVADGKNEAKEVKEYVKYLDKRIKQESPDLGESEMVAARETLPDADKQLAAMLAGRDNLALAATLEPLVGSVVSQKLFGIGVLGMAVSTIIILMLINGFAFCELINVPAEGTMHRIPPVRN